METFTELGCFKDSRSRLLTNMISSSDMTPTVRDDVAIMSIVFCNTRDF